MRDIGFEGTSSAHTFCVIGAADVRGLPHTSLNLRIGPRTFCSGSRLGTGRIPDRSVSCRASSPATRPISTPRCASGLAGLGITWGATNWLRTCDVHHRVAERFRDGPVFLAGDAAHVHSPVGAQGTNAGLQGACRCDPIVGRRLPPFADNHEPL